MQSITVLLSIENLITRVGIKTIINDQPDMCVVGECTGSDVMEMVNKIKPKILLLESNLMGPKQKETLEFIKCFSNETKFIVLTGPNDKKTVKALFELGVRGYIQKDDNSDRLLKAIRVVSLDGTWFGSISGEITSVNGGKQSNLQPGIPLSSRGLEILQFIEQGLTYQEISLIMGISYKTVCYHVDKVLKELEVHKALDAVMIAISHGWINPSRTP
jgi:DNA-binding NarL/FixJ family response regulator